MGISFHFLYRKLTANNLPISRLLAMTTTGMKLPANNRPIPLTEKNAAVPAINTDTQNNMRGNNLFIAVP
jgi:hypothetical protein